MFEIELRNLVKSTTSFATHWIVAPDDSDYPLNILNIVSSDIQYSQDGMTKTNKTIVQIDVWATDFDDATTSKNQLLNAFENYNGEFIFGIYIKNIRQGLDSSSEIKLYRYSIDITVHH